MNFPRRWQIRVPATITVVFLAALGGRAVYKHYRWKRFAIVEPGGVYRSGRLSESQISSAIERYDLRTVICLDPESAAVERHICEARKVSFEFFEMPADGLGDPRSYVRIVDLLRDPARRPVLVHCSAGVARTGASIALYRMVAHGWSAERAIDELRSFEHRGRCKPELQEHIRRVYVEHLAPRSGSQPIRIAAEPRSSPQ